jgi:pyrroline-5-carboxylate reductase
MIVGFCGSGNMAAAMARGWAGELDGMLFSDAGSGRAQALAEELGGEAVDNATLAVRSDLLVLAVKPAKLDQVAPQLSAARRVASILAGVPLARSQAAFPGAELLRVMPNVGVEVRRGVLCVAGEASPEVRERLAILGLVVDIDDGLFDEATAIMSCAPAYLALVAGALSDAGTHAGIDRELAGELVTETLAGTAELLRRASPAEVRTAVTSPGGSTEAGLEALERAGVRGAFEAAVAASLERMKGS